MTLQTDFQAMSDDELAALCASRPVNEEAWREFWRRFYPQVYRRVSRMLRSFRPPVRSEMQDIIQWIFLNIFKRLPNYVTGRASLHAYVNMVASSTLIDHLRVLERKPSSVSLEEIPELADKIRSGELGAETVFHLAKSVIERLEPRNQSVLLEFLEGNNPQEIAERHQVKPSLVYATVYRFRRNLRSALSDSASVARK